MLIVGGGGNRRGERGEWRGEEEGKGGAGKWGDGREGGGLKQHAGIEGRFDRGSARARRVPLPLNPVHARAALVQT